MRFTFKAAVVATAMAVVSSATLFAQIQDTDAAIVAKTQADVAKIVASTPPAQARLAIAQYILATVAASRASGRNGLAGDIMKSALTAVPSNQLAGVVSGTIQQMGAVGINTGIAPSDIGTLVQYAANRASANEVVAIASEASKALIAANAGATNVAGGSPGSTQLTNLLTVVAQSTLHLLTPAQVPAVVTAMINAAQGALAGPQAGAFIEGLTVYAAGQAVSGSEAEKTAVQRALLTGAPSQSDVIERVAKAVSRDYVASQAPMPPTQVMTSPTPNSSSTPENTANLTNNTTASPANGTDPTAGLPPTASGGTSSSTGADPTAGLPATASGGTTDTGGTPLTPGTNFGGASVPTNSGGGVGAVSPS